MNNNYPVQKLPAMPEYILAVLKDRYRQQCQFDPEAEHDVLLTFDSTVQEWREACDLIGWRKLARAMNDWFKTEFSDEQWKAVLEPAKEKRLCGVCELLATKATRMEIKPFGNHCVNAGIFLTIRSWLKNEGVQEEIKPSTKASPFFREHLGIFLSEIGKLEPGSLPPVKIYNPVYDYSCWAFGLGLLVCVVGSFWSVLLGILGVCIAACGYISIWIAAKSLPQKVEFGSIKTFRDLTLIIANARRERLSSQCTS